MQQSGRDITFPLVWAKEENPLKMRHIAPTHLFYDSVKMLMKNIIIK